MEPSGQPGQAAPPAAEPAGQRHEQLEVNEPKEWQRFYMGYKERFCDDCTIHLANGAVVHIGQAPSAAKLLPGPQQPPQASSSNSSSSSTNAKRGSENRSSRDGRRTDGRKPSSRGGSSGRGGSRGPEAGEQLLDRCSDPALTGTTVWDGAIVLAQYLTTTPVLQQRPWPSNRQHPIALELGAGTGAVAISLLASGVVEAAVVTDIPDMLPHLRANVARNAGVLDAGAAYVRALNWGNAAADAAALGLPAGVGPPFDLIVGSDLIYYTYTEATPHSRLLLSALHALSGPDTDIYLALSLHHNPGEVAQFLHWATEDGFRVEVVAAGQLPEEYRVWDVKVVRLRLSG